MTNFITKSDIKKGLQCLKLAHQARFNPTAQTPMDPYQQLLIDRGHHVGRLAQAEISKTYQARLLFESKDNFEDGLLKTKLALKDSRLNAYFEPTFVAKDLIVRGDILLKKENDFYDLIEVKSGSDMDSEYLLDISIQHYVLTKAGIKIDKTYIWMINKDCPLPDLTNLFKKVEITATDRNFYLMQIETVIAQLRKIFKSKKAVPVVAIGEFCSKPFECPFKELCHQRENKIPDLSVFNIPRIGKKAWDLYHSGIVSIDDIDLATMKFTDNQKKMISYTQSNEMFLDKDKIKEKLLPFTFPLYLIDFEAMDYDLPGFPNTKPGIHIAFQLSIKLLASPDGEIEEVAHYLHKDASDPRVALGEFLLKHIGDTGSIVAYSQAYEKGKIMDMAKEFTGLDKIKLEALCERLVDPLPIFREAVYHPLFKGSYSIKKVGPALLGEESSYESLEIKDGTQAVVAFRKMISSQNEEEISTIRNNLIAYCNKDTFVMGLLVKWLYEQIK